MESHGSSSLKDGWRRESETQLFNLGFCHSIHLGLSCPSHCVHRAAFADSASREDDLWRGEQPGRAASSWEKTSLCLFSGFRALPGAVEVGPLSSEELWRPQLLINRFSSFKEPISFQRGEFICKAPRRSQPNAAFRGGGLWLDLAWEQSHPLFADLFLFRQPQVHVAPAPGPPHFLE